MSSRPPRRGKRWWESRSLDWPGLIAFALAFGLGVGFAVALIMSASSRTPPVNEETATLLSTLGGAMVGAVATYLGMGRTKQQHDERDDDDDRMSDPSQ